MRGISPIVSTILMVAIAIAAAVVVYYITMDVVTQQGAQLQEQATTTNEAVVIDAVNVNGTSVDIYVRNVGDTKVTVTGFYVLKDGSVVCASTDSVIVNPGEVNKGTVDCSGTTLSGEYIAKVTTTGGAVAQKPFKV